MVASDAKPAGFDSELQVSVPKPSAARLAATAVALPPLDPDGAERRIVGVADGAADGADAEIAERELVEVGLAEDDGAAALHAGGDARIEARPMIDQRQRAAGGRQLGRVDVVLEDDRDAVERAAHACRRARSASRARASAIARGLIASTERNVGPWRS